MKYRPLTLDEISVVLKKIPLSALCKRTGLSIGALQNMRSQKTMPTYKNFLVLWDTVLKYYYEDLFTEQIRESE